VGAHKKITLCRTYGARISLAAYRQKLMPPSSAVISRQPGMPQ
jgi:hypothetical protein